MIPIYDRDPPTRLPQIVLLLIALNLFIYFFIQPTLSNMLMFQSESDRQSSFEESQGSFFLEWALIPCELVQQDTVRLIPQRNQRTGQSYLAPSCPEEIQNGIISQENRLLSLNDEQVPHPFPNKPVFLSMVFSLFFHASLLGHLLPNMLFLWIFGNRVENRLGIQRFFILYFAGGIIASLTQVAIDPTSAVPIVGASGAIGAVMGAYLRAFPRKLIITLIPPFFILPIPAALVLISWFLLQFMVPSGSGIAVAAHIGGFIAGFFFMQILGGRTPKAKGNGQNSEEQFIWDPSRGQWIRIWPPPTHN